MGVWITLFLTFLAFLEVKVIVQILEFPVNNVKFFQLSPGEYFVSTVKISFYTGLLFSSPFIIGLLFSYYALIPAALNFFLSYSSDVIEPFWSFDQYFEFILVLFYSTGLAFQIPIIQILLGFLNLVSAQQMFSIWRYVLLTSTIIGAILTPSTDPLTQLLLSLAIVMLYFSGASILFLIKN